MEIYGHRGACGYVAENTLPSMRRAIELGVDGIEFDVRLSRDGVPVVIHDETIDRTTSQRGLVKDFTSDALASLSEDDGENVPTLLSVLATIGRASTPPQTGLGPLGINVELKEHAAVEPTRDVLTQAVSSGVIGAEQLLLTSFDHRAIQFYRRISANDETPLAVGLLTKGIPDNSYWKFATELDAVSVNIDLTSVTADFVTRARDCNFRVMVYTVNTLADANRMRQLQVDAIFSDFPDRVRS